MTEQTTSAGNAFSLALIALMRGVIEREANATTWQALLRHTEAVRDHVAVLGLDLELDETEGFAYLAQRVQDEGDLELPRLVPRRPLPGAPLVFDADAKVTELLTTRDGPEDLS